MLTPREKSTVPEGSEESRTHHLDLDQCVANHPFTGIGATVGGAQFASTIGSWLLPEPI